MCLLLFLVLAMMITLAGGAISGLTSYRRLVRELDFTIHDAPRRADLADAVGSLFEPLLLPNVKTKAACEAQQLRFETQLADTRNRIADFHRKLDQLPPSQAEMARRPVTEAILGQVDDRLNELSQDSAYLGSPKRRDQAVTKMLEQVGRLQTLAQQVPDYDDGLNASVSAARDVYRSRFRLVFWTTGLSMLFFLWLGYYVYSRILSPLRALHQGAGRVAQGDLDYRVELTCSDDMEELAESFNMMTARFQETKHDLDRQVRERCNQLVRSERLAGIGFLAAGVAHEINNPLSAISMAADSLVARTPPAQPGDSPEVGVQRTYLEMIQREAERCQQITYKLLNFARGTETERRRHDLRLLVCEVLEMVRPMGKYQDRTIDFLRTEPCYAEVNGPEIKQVILNLVANSLESMEAGGTLSIRIIEQTDCIELIFDDDGCGMTQEVLDNLFEPFFTRRRGGKGTGLGMAICQRIIGEHGGTIEAASDGPNRGSRLTTFDKDSSSMTSFLEKRDPWGHGMALWVLLVMVFLVPLGYWSIRQIELKNDVRNWLPSDDPQSRILTWYEKQFPIEDRVLVSWNGSSLNDPRMLALSRKLEGTPDKDGKLRNGLPYVKSVLTPHDVIARMTNVSDGKISQETAIERMRGVLVGTGRLKVELTEAGRKRRKRVEQVLSERIREEFGIDVEILPSESELLGRTTYNKEVTKLLDETEEFPFAPEHDFQLEWKSMHGAGGKPAEIRKLLTDLRSEPTDEHPEGEAWIKKTFFFAGAPVAMFVTLSEAGHEEPRDAFKAIRAAAESVGIPEEELHLGGRSVASSELNGQVKRAAWNRDYPLVQLHRRSPILLSFMVSTILAFVMLRSFRLATLVIIVANFTTFITVALVPVTNGSMNMVLVVMPTLLVVLTMSAAIHVANYWKHAAERNLRTAVVDAARMARKPCILASLTTAVGLASLMTSPLRPVRDFGLYSAIGCVISLAVVLIGLPSLLMFWPASKPNQVEVERTFWKSFAGVLTRFSTPVALTSIVAFAVCGYGLRWFRTETKVIRYFPDDARVVQDYEFLEEQLAGIVPVDVVVRFDKSAMDDPKETFLKRMEIVRAIESEIRAHPEISGTISLADFQPVHTPATENDQMSGFERIQARARDRAKNSRTEEEAKREGSAAKSLLAVSNSETTLESPNGRKIEISKGDELWRITAQVAILSDLDYADLTDDLNNIVKSKLKYHAGADHVVTGMVPVFLRTQQAVLDSLITSFALAFVVIAIVMMFVLKHPISGLITMLPNLLPIGIVFGLISWARMPVDIGTMITASVALGIAVDGTLHLLTWFRNGIADGLSRKDAIAMALSHCGPAMWQTSAAVGIGLMMLYPAELLLIHRFGWLMAALIGAALVADVVFLPALLAGPLGHFIERSVHKQEKKSAGESPSTTTPPPAADPPAAPHVLTMMKNKEGEIVKLADHQFEQAFALFRVAFVYSRQRRQCLACDRVVVRRMQFGNGFPCRGTQFPGAQFGNEQFRKLGIRMLKVNCVEMFVFEVIAARGTIAERNEDARQRRNSGQGALPGECAKRDVIVDECRPGITNQLLVIADAAFKLARYHTGRKKMIAFFGAFHGRTMGALSLTGSKTIQRRGFGPLVPGVTHIEYPDSYRRPEDLTPEEHALACIAKLEDVVFRRTVAPDEVAGIFVEPIQGEGGYIVPPPIFHRKLKMLAEKHGILYIADEVQAGMGRTGRMFAIEHWGVEPDIICLAKGIASGMPLGAIVARSEIMNWPPGAHASTFGGNPISCAAALETIALLEEELIDNAADVGGFLMDELRKLADRQELIGDVRGKGLMVGVELVKDRSTKERASEERNAVVQACFRRGLLVLGCGENTVRLAPPLVIDREQAATAVRILGEAIGEVAAAMPAAG
eukprot:g26583.t1